MANHFDHTSRNGPKVVHELLYDLICSKFLPVFPFLVFNMIQAFVSEYAVTGKDAGRGSLLAALAEAGFLIGLEKNRSVVHMFYKTLKIGLLYIYLQARYFFLKKCISFLHFCMSEPRSLLQDLLV